MTRLANGLRAALLAVSVLGLAGTSARADVILEQYEFQGQPGTQTTQAPSFVTTGLSGVNFAEGSGMTPSGGLNSINASGWTNAGAFYSFGFTIGAGNVVTVDQLILTSRASATGPGFLNVQASVNGGAFTTVGSFTQTSTNFNDEILSITSVTATQSLMFRIVAANQTSAGGGTVGSAGTFRIGDFNPAGTPTPFTVNGTITSMLVPEPSSLALAAVGLLAAGVAGRARRRTR
jgi:hypothetical protein